MKKEFKEILDEIPSWLKSVVGFFLLLIIVLSVISSCHKYPDDNKLEELVEELIEAETGNEVDLTPWSEES